MRIRSKPDELLNRSQKDERWKSSLDDLDETVRIDPISVDHNKGDVIESPKWFKSEKLLPLNNYLVS